MRVTVSTPGPQSLWISIWGGLNQRIAVVGMLSVNQRIWPSLEIQ